MSNFPFVSRNSGEVCANDQKRDEAAARADIARTAAGMLWTLVVPKMCPNGSARAVCHAISADVWHGMLKATALA